jgi:hypothetical protein
LQRFHVNFYNLPETLQKKPIKEIRTGDLNKVMQEVNDRKYEDLRTLFNGIFKYAIASGIITHNPVAMIKFKRAERESHEAFTKSEIATFFNKIKDSKYDRIRQASYILFFFGLRPCEIDEELRREGEFLIARNRKRKNGKIEYKKIPITPMLKPYIKDLQSFNFYNPYTLREKFNMVLPHHKLYDLRTTFYSRSIECGVADIARKFSWFSTWP